VLVGIINNNKVGKTTSSRLNAMMENQWGNFLKNLGEWRGSFTSVSLKGELLDSTPSILTLEGLEENRLVRLRLRRFGNGGYDTQPTSDFVQDYRTLGRQIVFFETGAFSKGSIQLAPYSEFGAEYGFVTADRRLRFVQLYDNQGNLSHLVFIREFRAETNASERPPLTVEQLSGQWKGKAYTAYADWQPSEICETHSEFKNLGSDSFQQIFSLGDRTTTSTFRREGNILLSVEDPCPRQILLLPDGTSCSTPLRVTHREPFFVEMGWLVQENERQRLIRYYNEKGEWDSATHVIERKI
jgi:Domain of unknown function (DUF3598)